MPDKHQLPPHAVERPALRRQLDVGVRAPLTLIVAPAGSGKTVLLAEWVASRPDLVIAWLDLTAADADPVHFAQRLTRGLGAQHDAFVEVAESVAVSRSGFGPDVVDALAVSLAEFDGEVVLVFDDLHALTNRALEADLWRLAGRLPPNAHLIVSSRTDPMIRRSAHRLEHALVELRQQHLALGDEETARLLQRITGEDVAHETVAAVSLHTEGWAAGVQLAGLSLRFRSDESALVESLADTDRLVIEYLTEEVLDAQPAPRREALMAISVTDAVSADLARVLTGLAEAPALIDDLVRASMFLVPVVGHPGWFRFHHLFRDMLRHRLHDADPDAERLLLLRAAAWFRSQENASAAVDCLLRAGEWHEALELILARGREPYERGHIATLVGWLARLPADVRSRNVEAELLYAIAMGMAGDAAEGEAILRGMQVDGIDDPGARVVVHTYLAAAVQFQARPEQALAEGLKALELLDADAELSFPHLIGLGRPELLRTLALVSVGRACFLLGRIDEAREWMARGRDSTGGAYPPYRVHLLGSLAVLEATAGRLRLAGELADAALDLATDAGLLAHAAPGDAHIARALIAIQRGEPESGALALEEGMRRTLANRRTGLAWIGYLAAALIDRPGAEAPVERPEGTPPPIVGRALEALRLREARLEGRPSPSIEPQHTWSPLAFEEIASLLARGHAAEARARLVALRLPPAASEPASAVEAEICRAWILSLEGRAHPSRSHLDNALAIAAREGLLHVFVRAGGSVARMVEQLPPPADPFRVEVLRTLYGASPVIDQAALPEPLTARELELLAYLPTRLTNVELAERCYVSINTIKTHIAHIYRKLGVQGRSAAVERARELGLIEAPDAVLSPPPRRTADIAPRG